MSEWLTGHAPCFFQLVIQSNLNKRPPGLIIASDSNKTVSSTRDLVAKRKFAAPGKVKHVEEYITRYKLMKEFAGFLSGPMDNPHPGEQFADPAKQKVIIEICSGKTTFRRSLRETTALVEKLIGAANGICIPWFCMRLII